MIIRLVVLESGLKSDLSPFLLDLDLGSRNLDLDLKALDLDLDLEVLPASPLFYTYT